MREANFDLIALVIGYSMMVIGGVLIALCLLGYAMNLTWRKMQDAAGLAVLVTAYRQYKAARQDSAAADKGAV